MINDLVEKKMKAFLTPNVQLRKKLLPNEVASLYLSVSSSRQWFVWFELDPVLNKHNIAENS